MTRRDKYDSLLRFYSEAHDLDWHTLKAQMLAESDANPTAVSHAGAKGLMQFMGPTWGDWGAKGDPFNPEHSIAAGAKYMAWLLRQFDGDLPTAHAAYNFGIGNVRKLLERHPDDWQDRLPQETKEYLVRIERLRTGGNG